MIKKLSLDNFKAFQKMEELEIRNLTVVVGRNSCGKSSLMQSLLLLKQTLDSQNNSALCLEGKYLKFSNLKELSFGLPAVNSAKIGYELFLSDEKNESSGKIKLSFKNKKNGELYNPQVSEYKVEVNKDDEIICHSFLKMSKSIAKSRFKRFIEHFIKNNGELSEAKVLFNKFVPDRVQLSFKKTSTEGNEVIKDFNIPLSIYMDKETELNSMLIRELKDLRYLSPIRAMPERAYVHYSQDVSSLNEDGSNSAHILWAKREHKVKWKQKSLKLSDAVNRCIDTIGLSQEISPDKVGDIIYKVGIKESTSDSNVSLADVGFGYSQVIPIILLGLLNDKKNLMLIEQPEIHLHPSSAANLADLFLGFVEDDRRFIIETHSQEFINKLRLRVIQNPDLKKKINIVFVEQINGESSNIKQFEIDEKGMFPEWPDGFIDESEKLAKEILMARLESI
ncbi:MAG: putative ATPase [Vicingaceae bacterium]|jgi:predicted ATPase